MTRFLQFCIGLLCLSLGLFARAGTFDIQLQVGPSSGLTAAQTLLFQNAEAYWESMLIGVTTDSNVTLSIEASAIDIDGVGNILGAAGGGTRRIDRRLAELNGYLYNSIGVMQFDTSDIVQLETNNTLFDVVLHEIAHVIGFGDAEIWDFWQVYEQGSYQYTGANAVSAYQSEFGQTTAYVPIESNGGTGTANAHWAEDWAGPSEELMTGYLNGSPTISNTTLRSFADIGFVVASVPSAIPLPAPLLLLGSALGLLTMTRRYTRRSNGPND